MSALRRGSEPDHPLADWTLNAIAWAILAVPVRIGLGAVFLMAAWIKLRPPRNRFAISGPQDFAGAIKAFRLGLPDWLIRFSTSAVPWTEAIAAVLLILGFWTRAAAALIAAMTTLFTALVISAIVRDLNIKCGCFGEQGLICSGAVGWCKVFENGLLLAAALALMFTRTHLLSADAMRSALRSDR